MVALLALQKAAHLAESLVLMKAEQLAANLVALKAARPAVRWDYLMAGQWGVQRAATTADLSVHQWGRWLADKLAGRWEHHQAALKVGLTVGQWVAEFL